MFKVKRFEQVPLTAVKKVVEHELEMERSESGRQVHQDNLRLLEQILAANNRTEEKHERKC
jgi:hypothetical protein